MFRRAERSLILALLLALAAVCWIVLIRADGSAGGGASMALPAAPLFLAVWVVMMSAMMLPSAAPMVLAFHASEAARRESHAAFASTLLFVAGYLLVWAAVGLTAYATAALATNLARELAFSALDRARAGGVVVIAAGFYELTPLKARCLSKCRTPLMFIMTAWRDGPHGALLMGMNHGLWCLGCCWMLCAILFPLGVMSIAVMAGVTTVVLAEKLLPWRRAVGAVIALSLIGLGASALFFPTLLLAASQGVGGM